MSFSFLNESGSELSSFDVKQLLGTLTEDGEVLVSVYNETATNQPGVYLTPSTNLGELDYPGLNSPHSDYSDLLLIGSNTENSFGLKITKVENNSSEDVRFSFESGAAYNNKILLPQLFDLPAGSTTTLRLRYSADPSIEARRFYIGVNIDDS